MTTTKEYFGISCPQGGDFYICETSPYEFVGCCTSNPCTNSGQCPSSNLRVMTFQQNMYEELPPQLCPAGDGSAWYSCKFTTPPFLGCCKNNPCDTGNFPDGCGRDNLTEGRLAEDDAARYSFVSLPALAQETGSAATQTSTPGATATTTADSGSSTTGTSTGAAQDITSIPTSAPGAPVGGSDHPLSTGAIVGIVVGSVLVSVICVGLLMYRCGWSAQRRRNKRLGVQTGQQETLDGVGVGAPHTSPYQGSFHYAAGYLDQHDKYHSPQMTQYGSPNSLQTDRTAAQGGYYQSQRTSGGAVQELGIHQMEPQELPAISIPAPELPADAGGRLYQPYDTMQAGYGITPIETPRQGGGFSSSWKSPLVGLEDNRGGGAR